MNFQQQIIAERLQWRRYEEDEAATEARIDTLLTSDEYNPLLYLNFWEALTEASQRELNDLADLLREGRFDDAGREVLRITTEHWRLCARKDLARL